MSRHNVNGYSSVRGCSHSVLNSINSNYLPPLPPDGLFAPAYSLALDQVFGFERDGRRNLVAYAGEQFDIGVSFASPGFSRKVVSVMGRVAIVVDPRTSEAKVKSDYRQSFYEGHANKITCMSVHPSKSIVATAEASASPSIHLWSVSTCVCLRRIKTHHSGSVVGLAFNYEGGLVASLGMSTIFSL